MSIVRIHFVHIDIIDCLEAGGVDESIIILKAGHAISYDIKWKAEADKETLEYFDNLHNMDIALKAGGPSRYYLINSEVLE